MLLRKNAKHVRKEVHLGFRGSVSRLCWPCEKERIKSANG